MPPPGRDVVLNQQISEAKDEKLENNKFQSLQEQCNLLTKDVAFLLKKCKEANIY